MDHNITIQLIGDTEGFLDVKPGTAFPITFAVSDIRDISKRTGFGSKSITLSGTKNNHQLLNYYFDTNVEAGDFDINRLQECVVLQNGVVILDNAVMQLISVNKTQNTTNLEDEITYTVQVKDRASDFFTTINNRYLTDLTGFENMNHSFTAQNVIASFNNTWEDGYKYVLPFNPENPQNGDMSFKLNEFAPGIYVRSYFDRIFSSAGYTYTFDQIDDEDINFNKLIIPYNGDKLAPKNRVNYGQFYAEAFRTGTTQNNTLLSLYLINNNNNRYYLVESRNNANENYMRIQNVVADPSNLYSGNSLINGNNVSAYNTPNFPNVTGQIQYEFECNYSVEVYNPGATTAYINSFKNAAPWNQVEPNVTVIPKIMLKQYTPGGTLFIDDILVGQSIYSEGGQPVPIVNNTAFPPGTTIIQSGTTAFFNTTDAVEWNKKVYFSTEFDLGNTANNSTGQYSMFVTAPNGAPSSDRTDVRIRVRLNEVRVKISASYDEDLGYLSIVNMSKFIPAKVKQSDFIKSLAQMYNLYYETDRNNAKNIVIKTRDAYYDDGLIKDWSSKLDKSSDQDIQFLPELSNKKVLLTYKQDDDITNKTYEEATKEIYGQQEFIFDNEYVKGVSKKEVIFSPTPITNLANGAICPMWAGAYPKNNIRILLDGGELPCGKYDIYNYYFSDGIKDKVSGVTYPHLSHFNKPVNPTLDINFGTCDFYFLKNGFSLGSLTNNNLFNLHWRRTLEQINKGKMLTAQFNLNEVDIAKLSLSDKIKIDNSWWNINKVIDYDANSPSKLTKVELISVDENLFIPFQIRTVPPVINLPRPHPALEVFQILTELRDRDQNTILTDGNVLVKGQDNFIGYSGENLIVQGNDNNVWSTDTTVIGDFNSIRTNNGFVVGSNNLVEGTNIVVFGNGVSGTTDNTVYVNNFLITSGGTFNGIIIEDLIDGSTIWSGGTGNQSAALINDTLPNTASGDYSVAMGSDNVSFGINSVAEGVSTIASGQASHTEGSNTQANGDYSHAEGDANQANGLGSHAEGLLTEANGDYSHSEGINTEASGNASHAEGDGTIASGLYSHSEGELTVASGTYSHAQGRETRASGHASHAQGWSTVASGNTSNAQGLNTVAGGFASHAEGELSKAFGDSAHAEGNNTRALGDYSHSEGNLTIASGTESHAEGSETTASSFGSHSEGRQTIASGLTSHSEGYLSRALGDYSHAQGRDTRAIGNHSHAEGFQTVAPGLTSHAEGHQTQATGAYSHAEGFVSVASGANSHAQNFNTVANGENGHAEGYQTIASGYTSHAEGYTTQAYGPYSHAEGGKTRALGFASHAQNSGTTANGSFSHAEGYGTIASGTYSHAEGWNTISSGFATHTEGFTTQATGNYSHAEGSNTSATGGAAHSEGISTSASGEGSHSEGISTVASGDYSHAQGASSEAAGFCSHVEGEANYASGQYSNAGGFKCITQHHNEWGRGSGALAGQYGWASWVGQTTDNTPTELFLDGSSQVFVLDVSDVYTFEINVVGVDVSSGDASFWVIQGAIKNIGGTTTIVGTNIVTLITQDGGMIGTSVDMFANDTSDYLYPLVTGNIFQTINWNISMKYNKVSIA